jgi:hypothetical protein
MSYYLMKTIYFNAEKTKIYCEVFFEESQNTDFVVTSQEKTDEFLVLLWQKTQQEFQNIENFYPEIFNIFLKQTEEKINALKNKHNTGGVFALSHWWPTNLVTIPQWNYLRDMAREIKFDGGDMDAVMTDMDGNPFNWQTLDNGDIGLTANMVVTITNMGARDVNQNSQNAKRHITNLNASEHPEDYDFSDGWTNIYEG